MKLKNLLWAIPALMLGASFASCSDNNEDDVIDGVTSTKDTMLTNATTAYINNTVLPTYKGMADAAMELLDNCIDIAANFEDGTLTTADIQRAATSWKTSRRYWELSEAFLFGPAADYNIDPHIDSWPLDKDAMDRLLVEIRNGADYSIDNNFGYGLLGFHSIEYMLFELSADGKTSSLHSTNYTTEELKYLVMVAEDLCDQCICLEACWAGTDNISLDKQLRLIAADLDKNKNYGWMMINAGQAGSIYKTQLEVAEEIIQGCIDIADEVGNTKIGRPHSGSTLEDRNYIESPYSLNSIEDFQDNIRSIQNSYLGANTGDASISDYIKSVNPDLDTEMREAITKAINTIGAIPEPFAQTASGSEAAAAVTVVGTDLVNTLNKVYSQLSK
jgi:hypothetical protein